MQHLLIPDKKDEIQWGLDQVTAACIILIAVAAGSLIHVWLYG